VQGDNRLSPLLGDNAHLDLALLDVKDGIRRISLGEDLLVLRILQHAPPLARGVEEQRDVEDLLLRSLCHDVCHPRVYELNVYRQKHENGTNQSMPQFAACLGLVNGKEQFGFALRRR